MRPPYSIPEHPTEMIRMGIYRHYKGPLYQVQGLTHDANNDDRICVLYIGLEIDENHLGPRLAVRNLISGDDPFLSTVIWPSAPGKIPRNVPRFTYLGPVLEKWMLDATLER